MLCEIVLEEPEVGHQMYLEPETFFVIKLFARIELLDSSTQERVNRPWVDIVDLAVRDWLANLRSRCRRGLANLDREIGEGCNGRDCSEQLRNGSDPVPSQLDPRRLTDRGSAATDGADRQRDVAEARRQDPTELRNAQPAVVSCKPSYDTSVVERRWPTGSTVRRQKLSGIRVALHREGFASICG